MSPADDPATAPASDVKGLYPYIWNDPATKLFSNSSTGS
jgi:hypothetical protein